MADEGLLSFARELEAEDDRLAHGVRDLVALEAEVDALRTRAEAVGQLLAELPERRAEGDAVLRAAEEELQRRRAEADRAGELLAEAERASATSEELAAARREATRTHDTAASAERRAARARDAVDELARDAASAEADAPALGRRGHDLAQRMRGFPRAGTVGEPAPGVDRVAEWAARARGTLLVARSGLESERERVVRQGNELLAAVSGEAAPAATVTQVRERLEAEAAGHRG
jgi:DNA repair exonuclease SbcCD ATPase subunit